MSSDVYFNCPSCSHTILSSMELIGQQVECPDCAEQVVVPEVRNGQNPRFKGQLLQQDVTGTETDTFPDVIKRTELVHKGMVSLERRQERQNQKVGHLIRNMELLYRQIDLLVEGLQLATDFVQDESMVPPDSQEPTRVLIGEAVVQPQTVSPTETIPTVLFALSLACGVLTTLWWVIGL